MRRAMGAGVLGLVLAAGAAQAQDTSEYAYDVLDYKMLNTKNDPFRYYVDGRNLQPATVLIGQVQAAVDAAYQTWDAVSCAYPSFTSLGLSSNNPQISDARDPYDTFNVSAVWVTDSNDPYYALALGSGAAAAASIPLTWAGTLYQCDIYVNAVDFKWSTAATTPADSLDLQSFILHEIGHCMGLGHSEYWDDVMYPSVPYGEQRRALAPRDLQKVCEVFPQTGAVGSPCAKDADCQSASLECVAPPLPDGGTGAQLCSKGCTPTVPGGCDAPFVCKPSSLISGSSGACLPSRGDYVTQVGAPCTKDEGCGSAVGLCQPEDALPSQFPAWQGGYCTQNCAPGQTPCPAGSECVDFGNSTYRCMKTCRLGTGDCRAGYTCVRISAEVNLCVSSCHSNADCSNDGSFLCRLCDGTCVQAQNVSGTLGDGCQSDGQCGPGQFCLQFHSGGQSVGECAQSCSTAACSCPAGSSCHLLGDGNRYCLKDCNSGGQCAQGFQCGLLSEGRACIPWCTSDNECPVGSQCVSGQCSSPYYDAGTCVLCNDTADAGRLTQGKPPDAGSGGGSGGCGCQAPPGAIAVMLPLWLALLAAGSRQRSRHP